MKQTYPVQHGKETWQQLQEIGNFGYPMSQVFSDFLEVCLNTILGITDNTERYTTGELLDRLITNELDGRYEERYMQIVAKYPENKTKPYGQRPGDFFAEAFHALKRETHASQQDVLGELYESQLSLGEHGQFMTPFDVSRLVTALGEHLEGDSIYDSGVGSGRLLIAKAQQDPNYHLVGIDVSPVCARMAALNMWLFDLNADIYQGNILSNEAHCQWRIRRGGCMWEFKGEGITLP